MRAAEPDPPAEPSGGSCEDEEDGSTPSPCPPRLPAPAPAATAAAAAAAAAPAVPATRPREGAADEPPTDESSTSESPSKLSPTGPPRRPPALEGLLAAAHRRFALIHHRLLPEEFVLVPRVRHLHGGGPRRSAAGPDLAAGWDARQGAQWVNALDWRHRLGRGPLVHHRCDRVDRARVVKPRSVPAAATWPSHASSMVPGPIFARGPRGAQDARGKRDLRIEGKTRRRKRGEMIRCVSASGSTSLRVVTLRF